MSGMRGTQTWIFYTFFCKNRNLMVPRACKTRFWKIVFDSAEIFDFSTFSRMLSQRWNPFRVYSAGNETRYAYAQCAMKFVLRMLSMDVHVKTVHILPLAEHERKFVPRMLSVRWIRFRVCSVCNKVVSTYAQHAHAIIFENYSKIPN